MSAVTETVHDLPPLARWPEVHGPSIDDDQRAWTRGQSPKLSVLMPAHNEQRTIRKAVRTVLDASYPCPIELIVVDDGSTDRTSALLSTVSDPRLRVHRLATNRGKGAAIKMAARLATGTHIVPFDADLEYSPADLPLIMQPVLDGRCDVVFGTRLFGVNTVYQSYRYAVGGRILTQCANVLFDAYLSDLHTCLKLLPLNLFREMRLTQNGFGLDTEIAARVLSLGVRPFEVPVSYHSRTRAEGKKIGWRDGVECLSILARVRVTAPTRHRAQFAIDGPPSDLDNSAERRVLRLPDAGRAARAEDSEDQFLRTS